MCEKAVTLDDLSKVYHISKERVRQIELNSIKKIRKNVGILN
ncbi:MAG: sigma factor-like helix-turn-helix DNA-binding protein [Alphaproteobacteria bacterium]